MGLHAPREHLLVRWAELCSDTSLQDLPYKIELNAFGTIEMSPASTRHARHQAQVTYELQRQLPGGTALTECAIFTDEGIRVPDVAWASAEFMARHGDATPLPQAPEICVEVRSPSNTDAEMALKVRAFLGAGAVEVWIVSDQGELALYDAGGAVGASRYGVTLKLDAAR
jgi:Uma2 family endonuclease